MPRRSAYDDLKMNFKKSVFTLLVMIVLAGFALPQAESGGVKPISGGVVNGKAVSLPKPEFPSEVHVSGLVNVQVLIDESGAVVKATAVSGAQPLRASAEAAALKAKFSPTTLSGRPVKVSGVIVYNFTPPAANEQKLKPLEIAALLYIVRDSVNNVEFLDRIFSSKDFVREAADDYPELAAELAPLKSFKATPVSERLELIDKVIAAYRAKAGSAAAWQIELGRAFAECMTQLFPAFSGDVMDGSKVSEVRLRLSLARIQGLASSAPQDVPAGVLEHLKEFTAVDKSKQLTNNENIRGLLGNMLQLLDSISDAQN
jgi:Gram-negative bacterial TonB protein C-terminal